MLTAGMRPFGFTASNHSDFCVAVKAPGELLRSGSNSWGVAFEKAALVISRRTCSFSLNEIGITV